jgi:membrane protein
MDLMRRTREKMAPHLDSLAEWARDVGSFLKFLIRRYFHDECLTTASALTYTSLLALVPLMTIGFAIFRAFPAYESLQLQAQKLLIQSLVPEVGDAIQEAITRFSANAGQLTAFGIVGLTVTSVMMFSTIEGSFSAIWRVSEPRSLVLRLLAFWTILTLTPMLFGASLSLSSYIYAALRIEELTWGENPLAQWGVFLPGLFEWLGFWLLYLLIPNRAVRWQDAAIGGFVGAWLLEMSKAAFGWYISQFPAYQTIYGALSTIPIFLLWLYIAWSTVLVGAEVTAALPEWRAGKITKTGPEGLLSGQRIAIAVAILAELLKASKFGVGMRRRTLVGRIPVGAVVIDGILEQLRQSHWVARTADGAWVCTRDLSDATLFDLLKALGVGLRGTVRHVGELTDAPWQERCAHLLEAADEAGRNQLGIPIKDLVCPEQEDVAQPDRRLGGHAKNADRRHGGHAAE